MPASSSSLSRLSPLALALVAAFGAALIPSIVSAQAPGGRPPAQQQQQQPRPPGEQRGEEGGARPLAPSPGPRSVKQNVQMGDRTLSFTTLTGVLVLEGQRGQPEAEVGFVAYLLDGAQPESRPVTFAINGGPGSASAWLNLGLAGPWRLPMDPAAVSPSAPPVPLPNADTWLDFTDLVFVDPPGTGYARLLASGEDVQRRYFSVDGDITALSTFIRRWLAQNRRLVSPKFVLGESYAGFRGPRLAEQLASQHGIGLSGLILISPVLDFGWRGGSNPTPLAWTTLLPTTVAAARERKGPVTRESLADVEAYATGAYLADLLKGEGDQAARERLIARVTELTGLDPALVRRLGGRVDRSTLARELFRDDHHVTSAYDATVTGEDPYPFASFTRHRDPFTDALAAPVTSAIVDLHARRFDWVVDRPYRLSNGAINGAWTWGRTRSGPESVSALRAALAFDPRLTVLVAHGLTDLVTPYFESKLILDQLPPFGPAPRVRLSVFPGGHMFYSRDTSRAAFRAEAKALIEAAAAGRQPRD